MTVAIVSVVAVVLLGLSAGLFFAFTVAVMPGLRIVDDRTFVSAMTAINRAILTPLFMIVFVGALVVTMVAIVSDDPSAGWLVTSAVIYFLGVIVITRTVNVPLNVALDRDPTRKNFESRWVRFNTLRTVSATLSFATALVGIALAN